MAKKILVVEDDPTNATIIGDYLAAHGYEISIASDGVEGVARFIAEKPDLLVIDLLLPKKNGFDVTLDVRALPEGRDVPILLMSAVGKETYSEAYARADEFVQGYLRKPFTMAELVERVAALLGPA